MIDILTHDNAIIVAKVFLYGKSVGIFLSMFKDIENRNKAGVVIRMIMGTMVAFAAGIL